MLHRSKNKHRHPRMYQTSENRRSPVNMEYSPGFPPAPCAHSPFADMPTIPQLARCPGEHSSPPLEDTLKTTSALRSFVDRIKGQFNDPQLSDVTLELDDISFYSHRFILANSSDVFKTMLYSDSWKDKKESSVRLHESEECAHVFEDFLHYMYSAYVCVTPDNAIPLLCLADKYQVMQLVNEITEFMSENCKSPNYENALNWYPWAKTLNLDDLIQKCKLTLCWNIEKIFETEEWLNMDIDFIEDIIGSSDMVVDNEMKVWQAMSTWLLQCDRTSNLISNSKRLFHLIRFPQMYANELSRLETNGINSLLASSKDCSKESPHKLQTLLQKLIGDAYRFRALSEKQYDLELDFSDDFYSCRNYSSRIVDKTLIKNNVRFGSQVDIKYYRGSAPKETLDAAWKISYRKKNMTWNIQVYSHESSSAEYTTYASLSILILNKENDVIQVHDEPKHTFSRGVGCVFDVEIDDEPMAETMAVVIKPL